MNRLVVPLSKILIYLFGITTFITLLYEPHLEGRNINTDPFTIYFRDPFLIYIYFAFIPFFVALYQVLKVLRLIENHKTFSRASLQHIKSVKYCALTFILLLIGAEVYIVITQRGKDDIAGGVVIGLFIIVFSSIIAASAAFFEKYVDNRIT